MKSANIKYNRTKILKSPGSDMTSPVTLLAHFSTNFGNRPQILAAML